MKKRGLRLMYFHDFTVQLDQYFRLCRTTCWPLLTDWPATYRIRHFVAVTVTWSTPAWILRFCWCGTCVLHGINLRWAILQAVKAPDYLEVATMYQIRIHRIVTHLAYSLYFQWWVPCYNSEVIQSEPSPIGKRAPVTCAIFCTTGIVLFSVLLNNIMLYKTYLQPIKISEIFSGIFALQNCAIGAQR